MYVCVLSIFILMFLCVAQNVFLCNTEFHLPPPHLKLCKTFSIVFLYSLFQDLLISLLNPFTPTALYSLYPRVPPNLHPFQLSSLWAAAYNQNQLFEWTLAQVLISASDSTQQLQNISTAFLTAFKQQIT